MTELYTVDGILSEFQIGKFYYWLIIITGVIFASDSTEANLFQYIQECAGSEMLLNKSSKASLSVVVLVGELIGSFFFSALADSNGRRIGSILSCSIITIFSWLSGISGSFESLLLNRLLVGFGMGGTSIPFQILVEYLPPKSRGLILSVMRLFWSSGAMVTTGGAWILVGEYQLNWRYLVLLCAVPISVSSFLFYLYVPESPRWMFNQGRYDDAAILLRSAAEKNSSTLPSFTLNPHIFTEEKTNIKSANRIVVNNNLSERTHLLADFNENEILDDENSFEFNPKSQIYARICEGALSRYRALLSSSYFNNTIRLTCLWISKGILNYGVFFLIARINSSTLEGVCNFDYSASFISSSVEILGAFFTSAVIDIIGRPLTIGIQLITALLGLVGLLILGHDSVVVKDTLESVIRASLFGASTTLWILSAEIYSTDMRATAIAWLYNISRVGAIVGTYLTANATLRTAEIFFITICILQIVITFGLRDTTGTNLD